MKKLNGLLFLAAMTILTSCLKDGKVNLAPGASPMTVQWGTAALDDAPTNSAANIYRTYGRAYSIATSVKMDIMVDITGSDAASEDITVGVGVKAQAITDYNAKYATTYTLLPANMYTMPTSVTIPKGGRSAIVSIVLNTTLFDFSKSYVLPVTITSTTAGVVSGNYGTVLYTVAAKNKYDGIWTSNGTLVDNAAPTITGRYPAKYYFVTQSATSVAMYDYSYSASYAHQILSAGSNSTYGTFAPVFTFDASNNVTSVVNFYGVPANTRTAAIDPSGQNKFTSGAPGTVGAVFQCSYFMYQPNTIVGVRATFNETFTYVGARP